MRNGANADALSDQNETPKQLGRRSGISDAELTQYFGKKDELTKSHFFITALFLTHFFS